MLITIGASAAAALITWFLSRQKSKAETRKIEAEADKLDLENIGKAVEIWKKLASDMNLEFANVSSKCAELTREVEALRKENKHLRLEVEKLQRVIKEANLKH